MFKQIKECHLTIGSKWCESYLVIYPVSYRYNGGIVVGNKWYEGFKVTSPKVPKGYKLTSIACGLQLNARPPCATSYLEPLDGKSKSKSEVRTALASM